MRKTGLKHWKRYHGPARGTLVRGDPTVPATRWWNLLWLVWFVWKKVIVFEPQRANGKVPYRIGYRNQWGKAWILERDLTDAQYAVRLGREDCHFFAINRFGQELRLTIVGNTSPDDPTFRHVPLY